jgi:hypothetical protein
MKNISAEAGRNEWATRSLPIKTIIREKTFRPYHWGIHEQVIQAP